MNITSTTSSAKVEDKANEIYDFFGDDPNMSKEKFVAEFKAATDTSMVRAFNEANDMMMDRQLSRAAAFGRAHRNSRSK